MTGEASRAWLSTARTLVVCAVALALAVAGNRSAQESSGRASRAELIWVSYGAMALLAVKIFWQDFRQSPPVALAASLVCYGAVLIFGPRLTRRGAVRAKDLGIDGATGRGASAIRRA
jgi:hypothetical protein